MMLVRYSLFLYVQIDGVLRDVPDGVLPTAGQVIPRVGDHVDLCLSTFCRDFPACNEHMRVEAVTHNFDDVPEDFPPSKAFCKAHNLGDTDKAVRKLYLGDTPSIYVDVVVQWETLSEEARAMLAPLLDPPLDGSDSNGSEEEVEH